MHWSGVHIFTWLDDNMMTCGHSFCHAISVFSPFACTENSHQTRNTSNGKFRGQFFLPSNLLLKARLLYRCEVLKISVRTNSAEFLLIFSVSITKFFFHWNHHRSWAIIASQIHRKKFALCIQSEFNQFRFCQNWKETRQFLKNKCQSNFLELQNEKKLIFRIICHKSNG